MYKLYFTKPNGNVPPEVSSSVVRSKSLRVH